MRKGRGVWAVSAVMVLLGFLVMVQLRAAAGGSGLDNLSTQDLTVLVANLNTRNDQLRAEVTSLTQQLQTLQSGQAQGASALGALQADLQETRLWAGLAPVQGRGVQVQVIGPLPASAANQLLDDLRNAGAEALEVGGVRVVPGSVAAGPTGELSIENTALPNTFTVDAIGNPLNLTAALTRIGGTISQIEATNPDVQLGVTPVDQMTIPSTQRNLEPANASPQP